MYSNILIPVSLDADRDIDGAVAIARALAAENARLTVVHVVDPVPTYVADYIPPDVWQQRRTEAEERVKAVVKDIPNAHGLVLDGSSGRTITGWAGENDADLIVIASHRPVFSDLFLGSTASWVVRHADCAVHVIR